MKVAVVGAGPAGCAAAIQLSRQGAQVTLISDGRHGVGEQLHPANRPLLQQLGLLPLSGQLECVGVVCALSPSEPPWCQDFLCHPLGSGWLLDRLSFGQALRQAAVQAGVTLHEPSRLISLQRRAGWRLGLSHGELACDFVVDASGRRGVVARRLGVRRRRYLAQHAVLGWLTGPPEDSDCTLWVEALSPGWAYTCRVGTGRRVAAVLGPGRPQPARWWEHLQTSRQLRQRLKGYQPVGPVRSLPADCSMLEEFSGPGWLAIGDSAMNCDPLAGQGIFAALQAGLAAAQLVDCGPARLADYGQGLRDRFFRLLAKSPGLLY